MFYERSTANRYRKSVVFLLLVALNAGANSYAIGPLRGVYVYHGLRQALASVRFGARVGRESG